MKHRGAQFKLSHVYQFGTATPFLASPFRPVGTALLSLAKSLVQGEQPQQWNLTALAAMALPQLPGHVAGDKEPQERACCPNGDDGVGPEGTWRETEKDAK